MAPSRLAVQLYCLRGPLESDLDGSLERLAGFGVDTVEGWKLLELPGLGEAVRKAGLAMPLSHQRILGEDQNAVFEAAAAAGVTTVIEPWSEPERWTSADGIRRLVDELSEAAELAETYGLRVGYHNHHFEFAARIDGEHAFAYFSSLALGRIDLELDTYWAAVGGGDPLAVIERMGEWLASIQIKDGPLTLEHREQVAVGAGEMPMREILDASPDHLHVIEFDDTRGDRFETVAASVAFVKDWESGR